MTAPLDDAAHRAVYVDKVREELFRGVQRATTPRLVIVGGQPGCGKTRAVSTAAAELASAGSGVSVINGDELRSLHPDYARLVAEDRSTAADKTGTDVGRWVEMGLQEAARSGFNVVIETTMRQPVVVAGTMEAFRRFGDHTELRVLVVHPEVSGQAIYTRFAQASIKEGGFPRFTLASYHEAALAKKPETLRAVRQTAARIKFLDRGGRVLYDSDGGRDPVVELARLRGLPLKPALAKAIDVEWTRLRGVLDRGDVPELVRQGVRSEQERFAKLAQQLERGAGQGNKRDRSGPEW